VFPRCGRYQEHQAEFQRGQNRIAAEERDRQNQHHQGHREHDQVVPIFNTARWKWLTG
jgi:hypothetical protein